MKKIFLILSFILLAIFISNYSILASDYMDIEEEEKVDSHTHVPIQTMNESKEEFYVFDVGQGNSQLILYKEAKLGFLYDCGTSSKQKHPKLQSLQNEDWNVFLTKKIFPKKKLQHIIIEEDDSDELMQLSESESKSMSNKESDEIENISNSIRSIIENAALKWLIIFLSHPDKDHISLVNYNAIPIGLKTLAFLGGDFLGKEDSTEVQKVLNFLKERDNTWVEMPFYWNWSYDSYPKTYQNIRESFLDPAIQKIVKNLSLSEYNPEDFFHGSCWDLLMKVMTKNKNFKDFIVFNEYLPLYSVSENSLTTKNRKDILQKQVLIWSMNHRLYDVNAQSTVVSFKLPENDIRLICTGDAEDATFWRIKEELRKRSIIIPPKAEKRENILIVPHHGSQNNISNYMIDLFNPTIFIISAGNGKQYGHPRLETIEWLRTQIGQTQFYSKEERANIIAFYTKGKEKKAILKNSIKEGSLPILGTNVMGTIRYTQSDFSSLFKSLFEIENQTYRIDFRERVMIDDLEQIEDSCFYKKNDDYYYRVDVEGEEDLYYPLIREENIEYQF